MPDCKETEVIRSESSFDQQVKHINVRRSLIVTSCIKGEGT